MGQYNRQQKWDYTELEHFATDIFRNFCLSNDVGNELRKGNAKVYGWQFSSCSRPRPLSPRTASVRPLHLLPVCPLSVLPSPEPVCSTLTHGTRPAA